MKDQNLLNAIHPETSLGIMQHKSELNTELPISIKAFCKLNPWFLWIVMP